MRETRRKQTTSWLIIVSSSVSALLCLACGADADAPRVDFGVSKPVGRWDLESAQALFGDASVAVVSPSEVGAGGKPASAASATTVATRGSMNSPTQSGPSKANAGAAGQESSKTPAADGGAADKSAAAGSGGSRAQATPADEKPKAVTALTFNFSTEPIGGRYKPKNIGAVWISDSSGKLIKSLEVWAFLRLRYLTKYAGVRAGARTDVTASATLPNHSKPHMASWDLKDTTGASVPPGKYTLNAEITDQDATGKSMSFEFDTSAGPMTLMPANSTGFTQLELVLK